MGVAEAAVFTVTNRSVLDQRLADVRSRWIARDTVWSASRMIAAVVPACLLAAWIDYRIEFSRTTRFVELFLLTAGLIWAIRRWVMPVLHERRNAYTAALRVEAADPRFGGRLISCVQFAEVNAGARGGGADMSGDLIAAMRDRVEKQASGVDFANAVDTASLCRPGLLALILLLLAVAVAVKEPQMARLWLVRTLWPFGSADWPRRTFIDGIRPEYQVRRGDFVVISGTTRGEIPREGEVSWRIRPEQPGEQARASDRSAAGSGGSLSFDMDRGGGFTARVGPLLEPVELSISVGDASVDGVRVEVVRPPEVSSIEAVYHYPEFTGRKSDKLQSGDVRALVGTRVDLSFTADRPVQRAEICMFQECSRRHPGSPGTAETERPAIQLRRVSRPAATTCPSGPQGMLMKSPLEGQTSFTVRSPGRYQIRLFDAYGFSSDNPATFVIDPVDNELPVVAIRRPNTEHTVTPATRLALLLEASDDYGVTEAVLCWWKREKSQTQPTDAIRQQVIPVGAPRKKWNARYMWDLAAAGLQAGDELEYYVQAGDAGEHLTPQKAGRSTTHVLKVTDPETLRQALEGRLKQLFGEVEHLRQQQTAGMDAVSMAILSLPGGQAGGAADITRVQSEYNRQVGTRRQLERVADQFARVSEEMAESFLADPARIAELKGLAKGLADLAGQPMQFVVEELERAKSSLDEAGSSWPSGE